VPAKSAAKPRKRAASAGTDTKPRRK
jgi:hypothetical protein